MDATEGNDDGLQGDPTAGRMGGQANVLDHSIIFSREIHEVSGFASSADIDVNIAAAAAPQKSPQQRAREAAGLSREEVAAAAGLSFQTIWRCERHGRWPRSLANANAMRRALGIGQAPTG